MSKTLGLPREAYDADENLRLTLTHLVQIIGAPSSLQRGPAPAADAAAVRVDRVADRRLVRPAGTSPIGFDNVAAQVQRGQVDEHLIAVIHLIGDHFVDDPGPPSVTTGS